MAPMLGISDAFTGTSLNDPLSKVDVKTLRNTNSNRRKLSITISITVRSSIEDVTNRTPRAEPDLDINVIRYQ